jgi:hypothetical protein
MEFSENKKENQEEFPATLDVVKIDGRWAQVVGSKDGSAEVVIKFLDNDEVAGLDLGDYELTRRFNMVVAHLKQFFGEELPKGQAEKVHWGPEEIEKPELRGLVTVFGEYKKPS